MVHSRDEQEPFEVCTDVIQPHGCVCICDLQLTRFTHVSQNVSEYFGKPVADILGRPLNSIFDREFYHTLRNIISLPTITSQREYLGKLHTDGGLLEAACHQRADCIIIEFQHVTDANQKVELDIHRLRWLMAEPDRNNLKMEDVFHILVHDLRVLTNFDRVVAFRFPENEPGQPISESSLPHIKNPKNQTNLIWDTPQRTRETLTQQSTRFIKDFTTENISLMRMRNETLIPDMMLTSLRGEHDIQTSDFGDLKMRSSLSLPININNSLWGIISFQNSEPKPITIRQELALELVGKILTLYVKEYLHRSSKKSGNLTDGRSAMGKYRNSLSNLGAIAQSMIDWDSQAQTEEAKYIQRLNFRSRKLAETDQWILQEKGQSFPFRNIAERALSSHRGECNLSGPDVLMRKDTSKMMVVLIQEAINLLTEESEDNAKSTYVNLNWELESEGMTIRVRHNQKGLTPHVSRSKTYVSMISSTIRDRIGGDFQAGGSPENSTYIFRVPKNCLISSDDNHGISEPEQDTDYDLTILLIEDNISLQEELRNDMVNMGYNVKCADNVQEAERILDKTKFDALILDMFIDTGEHATKEGTLRIVSRIRNEINNNYLVDKDVPILAISGAIGIPGGFSPLKMAQQIGVNACMPKPIDKDELEEWLSNI